MYRWSYNGRYDDEPRRDDRALVDAASSVDEAESVACNCVSFNAIMPLETSSMTRTADINIVKNDSDYIGKKTMLHLWVGTYVVNYACM